jgi:predicted MFS family arabinose efflux permease
VLTTSEVTLRQRFDVPGVILATGGLVALVFACSQAVPEGWGSPTVVALLLTSALLLCPFAVRETRAPSPLLPLRVLLNRNRGGAYVSVMLVIAGMFGAFLFLTYYLQVVLRYSPVEAGLGFLPIAAASRFGSWAIASLLMPHVPPRALIAPGALMAAAGMLVLTQLQITGSYLTHVLPAEILVGIGIACVMVPAFSTATLGVDQREAGAAAATVNTASQVVVLWAPRCSIRSRRAPPPATSLPSQSRRTSTRWRWSMATPSQLPRAPQSSPWVLSWPSC